MLYVPSTRNARIAYKKLEKIALKVGYGKVDYKILSRMLNREFKSMKVRFRFKRVDGLDDYISATGYYIPPHFGDDHRYEVQVFYGGKTQKLRRKFYTEIYFILVHEFRHGYQYRARKFRHRRPPDKSFLHASKPFQEEIRYLMDYDEIDAYAMEIAESRRMGCELVYRQANYQVYKDTIPKMTKPWKKLMKKIYKYSGGIKSCYL